MIKTNFKHGKGRREQSEEMRKEIGKQREEKENKVRERREK